MTPKNPPQASMQALSVACSPEAFRHAISECRTEADLRETLALASEAMEVIRKGLNRRGEIIISLTERINELEALYGKGISRPLGLIGEKPAPPPPIRLSPVAIGVDLSTRNDMTVVVVDFPGAKR